MKFVHVLGVVLLVGNVTVTAVWKVFADRSNNPVIVAFAQRLVTVTDFSLTALGILLILVGGFGAAAAIGVSPVTTTWVIIGEVLFGVSGMIWLLILIPLQIRQARMARAFAADRVIPAAYREAASRWLVWGIVATLPLLMGIWVMIAKPG